LNILLYNKIERTTDSKRKQWFNFASDSLVKLMLCHQRNVEAVKEFFDFIVDFRFFLVILLSDLCVH